ncbi:TPA: hypothetical protein ACQTXT_006743 [Pseudomonas aeruginosa]
MTTMLGSESRPHGTLMRVAAVAWLLLICAAVAINRVALSGLTAQIDTRAPSRQVAALEKRLAELIQQVEHAQQQPVALPQARYEAEREALELRLSAIEASLGNQPATDNLLPLQTRLEQLEMRLSAPPPAPPTPPRPRAAATTKPKTIEPPFRVIGTELRAGEPFLSIMPAAADALAQVRLLRPGEAEAGWQLETIERNTAVFRHGNDSRRLPIPER